MKHTIRLVYTFGLGLVLLLLGGCGKPAWNSDYNLNQALAKGGKLDKAALADADTTKPSLESKLPLDQEKEEKKEKKRQKQNRRYFLGHKVQRGFVKTGSGERETIETFSYLPEYIEPSAYAPEKYLFDAKKRKLYRTRGEADPAKYKVLHGPYKKEIGGQVVEEGYFYVGTKHLRWERYRRGEDEILLDKDHYEKGFQRDAVFTYYNGDQSKVREVIPYEFGKVQGMYYRFYENGQLEWSGQYEKGRKVGVWIKHYDFRGRRHSEYQYPKTAYEAPAEPYLLKQYDRHGKLIYEKDKMDKRSQAQR